MKDLLSLCLFQTVLLLVLQNISICHADTSALYDLEKRYNEEHIGNNRAYGGHVDAQGEADVHAEGETFGNSDDLIHSLAYAEPQPYIFGGFKDIAGSNFNNYQANNERHNIGRSHKKLETTTNYRRPYIYDDTMYTTYGIVRANDDSVKADNSENVDTVPSRISSINDGTSNVNAVSNAAISSNAGTSASASASASSCACDRGSVASDDVSFLCFSSKDGGKSFDIKYKGATKFSFEEINKAYKFYYDNMLANNFFVENNINGANKGDNKFNFDTNKFKVNTFYEGSFFFNADSQFNASTYENFNINDLDLNNINFDLIKKIIDNKKNNNKNEFNFDVNKNIDINQYIEFIKLFNTSNQSNLDVNTNIDINKILNDNHGFNLDDYKIIELIKLLNNKNQFNFDVNKNIDINQYIEFIKLLNTSNQFNWDVNNHIDINKILNDNHRFNLDAYKIIELIKLLNNKNQFNFDVNKNIDINQYIEFIKLLNTSNQFNWDVNNHIDINKILNDNHRFNLDAYKIIELIKLLNNKNQFNFGDSKNIDINQYIDFIKHLITSNQSNLDVNNNIDINKIVNYNHGFNLDAYKIIELIKFLNNRNQFNFDVNENIDINKYLNLIHLLNFDVNKNIDINKKTNNINQFIFDAIKNDNQNNFNYNNKYGAQFGKKINSNFNFNFDTNTFDSEAQYKAYIQAQAIAKAQAILEAQARAQAEADALAVIQKQINDAQINAKTQVQPKTPAEIETQTFGQPPNKAVFFGLGGGKLIKGGGGFNLALNGGFGAKFGLGKQINVGKEPRGLPSSAFGTSAITDGDYDLRPHVGGYIDKGDINYADPMYEDNLEDIYKDYSSGSPGVFAHSASINKRVPTPRHYDSDHHQASESRKVVTA